MLGSTRPCLPAAFMALVRFGDPLRCHTHATAVEFEDGLVVDADGRKQRWRRRCRADDAALNEPLPKLGAVRAGVELRIGVVVCE